MLAAAADQEGAWSSWFFTTFRAMMRSFTLAGTTTLLVLAWCLLPAHGIAPAAPAAWLARGMAPGRQPVAAGTDVPTPSRVADEPDGLATRLQQDLRDGELQAFSLFQAALIAGGIGTETELEQWMACYDEWCSELRAEVESQPARPDKVDMTLRWLHARILTGKYRAECSALPESLQSGDYNCVTATILFQALADACGLHAYAIAGRAHLLCGVAGQEPLYVETTCRDWRSAALTDCPPRTQDVVRDGRELNAGQLLGKLYYNSGVEQLAGGEYRRAVELLETAWALDRHDTAARLNLLAAFNNWALAAGDSGDYCRAVELLQRGLAIDGGFQPLLANDLHLHQKWIRSLCDSGDFSTAVALAERGRLRRPDAALFVQGSHAIRELWAKHCFTRGDLAAGWSVLAAGLGGPSELDDARALAIVQGAFWDLVSRGEAEVATQLLRQAEERYPSHRPALRQESRLLSAGL